MAGEVSRSEDGINEQTSAPFRGESQSGLAVEAVEAGQGAKLAARL